MRVLYDSSAILTILARRGEILKFKGDAITKLVEPIVSDYILDEVEEVLSAKFAFTKQKAKSHIRLYARIARIVYPRDIEQISRDQNDDPILAAAVIGGAEYIVTLDEDLLTLREHRGILIITLSEFNKLKH